MDLSFRAEGGICSVPAQANSRFLVASLLGMTRASLQNNASYFTTRFTILPGT